MNLLSYFFSSSSSSSSPRNTKSTSSVRIIDDESTSSPLNLHNNIDGDDTSTDLVSPLSSTCMSPEHKAILLEFELLALKKQIKQATHMHTGGSAGAGAAGKQTRTVDQKERNGDNDDDENVETRKKYYHKYFKYSEASYQTQEQENEEDDDDEENEFRARYGNNNRSSPSPAQPTVVVTKKHQHAAKAEEHEQDWYHYSYFNQFLATSAFHHQNNTNRSNKHTRTCIRSQQDGTLAKFATSHYALRTGRHHHTGPYLLRRPSRAGPIGMRCRSGSYDDGEGYTNDGDRSSLRSSVDIIDRSRSRSTSMFANSSTVNSSAMNNNDNNNNQKQQQQHRYESGLGSLLKRCQSTDAVLLSNVINSSVQTKNEVVQEQVTENNKSFGGPSRSRSTSSSSYYFIEEHRERMIKKQKNSTSTCGSQESQQHEDLEMIHNNVDSRGTSFPSLSSKSRSTMITVSMASSKEEATAATTSRQQSSSVSPAAKVPVNSKDDDNDIHSENDSDDNSRTEMIADILLQKFADPNLYGKRN